MYILLVSTEGWIEKQTMVHPYNGMFFSLKRKAVLTQAAVGMNLEGIMFSDVSQTQKNK